eukprot:8734272-Pyramimonas_sp.AAC.1
MPERPRREGTRGPAPKTEDELEAEGGGGGASDSSTESMPAQGVKQARRLEARMAALRAHAIRVKRKEDDALEEARKAEARRDMA